MRWTTRMGFDVELIGDMRTYPEGSSTPMEIRGAAITVRTITDDPEVAKTLARAHAGEHGLQRITSVNVTRGPFAVVEPVLGS